MLSAREIKDKIRAHQIAINDPDSNPIIISQDNQDLNPEQLQAHGYDLQINRIQKWNMQQDEWDQLGGKEAYKIKPGEFVIIETYERVKICNKIGGTIHSLARQTLVGLSHISTTVHPGWGCGDFGPQPFHIAVYNWGKVSYPLQYRERFCRLIFHEMKEAAIKSAPSLKIVTNIAKHQRKAMKIAILKKQQLLGWILIGIVSIASIGVLAIIGNTIVVPIIVALLTITVNKILRKYLLI